MGFWSIIVPEATRNYVKNPVAGTTGNYAAVSSGTVSATNTAYYGYFGMWHFALTTAADNQGMSLTMEALANAIHYVTVRLYGAAGCTWDMSVDNSNYYEPTLLDYEGNWYVYGYSFLAAQCSGSTTLYIRQKGAGAGAFKIGHVQVEQKEYATTPVTGDLDNCYWVGTPHGSASVRPASARNGGRVYSLDTYSYYLSDMAGVGMPQVTLHEAPYALIPGAEDQGEHIEGRTFLLTGDQEGSTWYDMHGKRKDLIDVIKPDLVKRDGGRFQPFWLRYTGAASTTRPVQIQCKYAGGLDFTERRGFTSYQAMQLRSVDPRFYEVHHHAIDLGALAHLDVANANRVLARISDTWQALGTGANNTVYCVAQGPDKTIYIGGAFTTANSVTVNYIAKWTGSTFATVGGTSCNGAVWDLIFDPAGNLYAIGAFTTAPDGTAANRIAKWNGSAWSALDTGLNGTGLCLGIDHSGNVYAGGDFTTAGGTTVNHIAKWNGSAWAAMGSTAGVSTGGSDTVRAIVVDNNDYVHIGGLFTTAGGSAAVNIAYWDGSSWSTLGSGCTGGSVYALALGYGGNGLWVGGDFTAAGGLSSPGIALNLNLQWLPMGEGISGGSAIVRAIAVDADGLVYVGGNFTSSSSGKYTDTDTMIIWNGSAWAHMPVSLSSLTPTIYDMVITSQGDIYLGFAGNGTAITSKVTTITNSGTAETYPILRIKAATASTLEYIKNLSSGKTIWLDYYLQVGEELVIDFRPGKRKCTSSLFGSMWSAILRNSDVTEFSLLPGSNSVEFYVKDAGLGYAVVEWELVHWSVDGAAA